MGVNHASGCRGQGSCSCADTVQCPAVYITWDGYYENVYRCTLAPVHPGDRHDSNTVIRNRKQSWTNSRTWRDASRGVTYAPKGEE